MVVVVEVVMVKGERQQKCGGSEGGKNKNVVMVVVEGDNKNVLVVGVVVEGIKTM